MPASDQLCYVSKLEIEGAVTLGNFSCNLSRNFVATQVARIVA